MRWISAPRTRTRSASHGGLTPPALVSRCERLPAKKTIFAIHIRTSGQERRASARRGFVNRVRNGNAVDFGASNPHAECIPRGAYAPRSCFAVRTSADKKNDFCDTHTHIRSRAAGVSPPWFENRTCEDNSAHIRTRPSHAAPGAAGVSPPWVCKPRLQLQCDEFRRFEASSSHRQCTLRGPYAFGAFTWSRADGGLRCDEFARRIHPTGGLRPPLLLQCERLPAKNDFCDTHTHIRSRAAPVSPPWLTKRTCHAVRFTFGKPRPSKNRGQTAAVRSVERCLRCVGNAHA
jgi:hypothetical protein